MKFRIVQDIDPTKFDIQYRKWFKWRNLDELYYGLGFSFRSVQEAEYNLHWMYKHIILRRIKEKFPKIIKNIKLSENMELFDGWSV